MGSVRVSRGRTFKGFVERKNRFLSIWTLFQFYRIFVGGFRLELFFKSVDAHCDLFIRTIENNN